jgi:hypothetical protein
MEHVMMVVPVYSEKNKTEHVGQEDRPEWTQCIPVGAVGDFQLKNHYGNKNGDDGVTKCF